MTISDTQPCSLCGNPADSIGLEDEKLYCANCTFGGKAPHQTFEWILPAAKEEVASEGARLIEVEE